MQALLPIVSTRKCLFWISCCIVALVSRYPSNSNFDYLALILSLNLLNICIVTVVHSANFNYEIIDTIKCSKIKFEPIIIDASFRIICVPSDIFAKMVFKLLIESIS